MQKKAYRFYSTFFPCAESMRAIPSAQDERILPIRTFAQSVHRIPIYIAHGHCQWSNKSMYAISEPWCARISLKREELLHWQAHAVWQLGFTLAWKNVACFRPIGYILRAKGEILSFIKSCDLFLFIQPDVVHWLGNDRDLFQI